MGTFRQRAVENASAAAGAGASASRRKRVKRERRTKPEDGEDKLEGDEEGRARDERVLCAEVGQRAACRDQSRRCIRRRVNVHDHV